MVWVKARTDALDPLTPHEARHCAASYLIEAGLNDLELTTTIGHSAARTTKDVYGHLFPDSGAKIAAKLDAYLDAEEAKS
jgi:integrase